MHLYVYLRERQCTRTARSYIRLLMICFFNGAAASKSNSKHAITRHQRECVPIQTYCQFLILNHEPLQKRQCGEVALGTFSFRFFSHRCLLVPCGPLRCLLGFGALSGCSGSPWLFPVSPGFLWLSLVLWLPCLTGCPWALL